MAFPLSNCQFLPLKKMAENKIKKIAPAKKTKKELQWSGAQSLMGPKPQAGTVEERERNLILVASNVMKVSPFGINILGGNIYANKLALAQKANQYRKNIVFKYNWVQRALDDSGKAICECKIVEVEGTKERDLSDWITGECSPKTMKMGTLTGYQNHMAQTRAKNRAIQETFGVRIHEEMIENLYKLKHKGEITEKEIERIAGASSTSIEEINAVTQTTDKGTVNVAGNIMASQSDVERIWKLAWELGMKKISDIKKATEDFGDFSQLTKVGAMRVITKLMAMEQEVKSKK